MYVIAIALFMLILPVASIAVESARQGGDGAFVVAKWFVFWGVGVRLLVAGIRQVIQPQFTARTAGINHLQQGARNRHENIAMVSDLLLAALLAGLCVHAVPR